MELKYISYLYSLLLTPYTKKYILLYLISSVIFTFTIFENTNQKVNIILTNNEKCIIFINLVISVCYISLVLSYSKSLYDIENIYDIHVIQLLYVVLWVVSDEILFFVVHKLLLHGPLYSIHKMHHKFKITTVWTTFYAHPLDNLFVLLAATLVPFIMSMLEIKIAAPVIALYLSIAVTTFISSHHTVLCIDTPHLLHHKLYNVNFGNFWLLDYLFSNK